MKSRVARSGAAWVPAWTLAVVLVAMALRTEVAPVSWWAPLGAALVGVPAAVIVTFATDRPFAVPHRAVAVAGACVWAAVVAHSGWSERRGLVLVFAAVLLAALEYAVPSASGAPVVWQGGGDGEQSDRRPESVKSWEGLLRRTTKKALVVRSVDPWERRGDGERVVVDLPEDMTLKDVAAVCDKLAAGRRLPQGCVVRALDGDHQGQVVLDVMLRDCLAGEGRMVSEPTTPASINDPFDVAFTPRGEQMPVCLREESMVVGGTTNAGKTTLLHRIIFRLARCTDTLIWVADPNGGGVAEPWIKPWALGQAETPTIDWLAESAAEAAVMLAVARAVAKDRKTSKEASRRKRAANSTVLPVDAEMPAILIITDEGAEFRQAAGLLALIVDEGFARAAQIGRAEGLRIVMSVLRGTGDLLNKGLRTVAGIRVCLRMNEEDEYGYILGVNPGRARLLHKGSAYVYRTDTDHIPVLARTVNVLLDGMEQHAIATAHLRPKLDARAQQVAARLTVRDVLEGRDPTEHRDIARMPVMRDVEAGRAYSGRWDRQAAILAEMRGEDAPEVERAVTVIAERPTAAPPGSAAERLLLGTGTLVEETPKAAPAIAQAPAGNGEPDVMAEAEALLSPQHMARRAPLSTRDAILPLLRDAYPDLLTNAQVHSRLMEMGIEVSPQRSHQVLKSLVEKREARQDGAGYGHVA
ncbi:hypothetical protein [Micromonospora sp. NPDC049204]|uniref:hypothetical protein n=1 Tax=Micromonospora sp. NPDC049204 TaxID=3154351 RepID=UPI0033E9319E